MMLSELNCSPRDSCRLKIRRRKGGEKGKKGDRGNISIFPLTMTAERSTLMLPIPLRHFFFPRTKGDEMYVRYIIRLIKKK